MSLILHPSFSPIVRCMLRAGTSSFFAEIRRVGQRPESRRVRVYFYTHAFHLKAEALKRTKSTLRKVHRK